MIPHQYAALSTLLLFPATYHADLSIGSRRLLRGGDLKQTSAYFRRFGFLLRDVPPNAFSRATYPRTHSLARLDAKLSAPSLDRISSSPRRVEFASRVGRRSRLEGLHCPREGCRFRRVGPGCRGARGRRRRGRLARGAQTPDHAVARTAPQRSRHLHVSPRRTRVRTPPDGRGARTPRRGTLRSNDAQDVNGKAFAPRG